MNSGAQPPIGVTALIYVVVIAFFVWRMMRPTRISVARIWSRPIILLIITAVFIWAEQRVAPAPPLLVAAIALGGAVFGIPFGIIRGHNSEVKSTDRPGIYYVHSSPLVIVVWLIALVGRAAIRYAVPHANHGATIWSFGLLTFATSTIVVSAFLIHQKLAALQQRGFAGPAVDRH